MRLERRSVALLSLVVAIGFTLSTSSIAATISVALDDHELLVGEAISGEVIITNDTSRTIECYSNNENLFDKLYIELQGPGGQKTIMPYVPRRLGHYIESSDTHVTQIPPRGAVADMVFLLTHRGKEHYGAGYGAMPVQFYTDEPGQYSLIAGMTYRNESGDIVELRSSAVLFEVSDGGYGINRYREALDGAVVKKPFQLYFDRFTDLLEDEEALGDYVRPLRKVVAYQYGMRLSETIRRRSIDKYREANTVLEYIEGGLVSGTEQYAAHRWRIALIRVWAGLYEQEEPEIVSDKTLASKWTALIPQTTRVERTRN